MGFFFRGRDEQAGLKVLKSGHAMRIVFFYPGEEGTYVDNCDVTLFENGIVHIASPQEETTTHLQNCEILWSFDANPEERKASPADKIRILNPRSKKGEPPTAPSE